jgi:hypothetical protein
MSNKYCSQNEKRSELAFKRENPRVARLKPPVVAISIGDILLPLREIRMTFLKI